jgi:hypothetical protein
MGNCQFTFHKRSAGVSASSDLFLYCKKIIVIAKPASTAAAKAKKVAFQKKLLLKKGVRKAAVKKTRPL